MRRTTLLSPAKLNLFLQVVNKRPDGYHNLKTLFERIDLADEISFASHPHGRISIRCDHPHVPVGKKNFVYKMASMLREELGVKEGVDVRIKKCIPVAAGLAGGSSNAATALLGLDQIWRLSLSPKQRVNYAKRIGSDVAFFLYDTSWALGTERGDRIQPLSIPAKLWHVLVVPCVKMYSREVFTHLNLELTKGRGDVNILIHYLKNNQFSKIKDLLANDLESSILTIRPKLSCVKERFQSLGFKGVSFSGSGPAVFGLVQTRQEAEVLRDQLQKRYRQVFIVQTR